MSTLPLRMAAFAALAAGALWLPGCAAILASNEPMRSDELIARIETGMSMDDVRRLLGPPDETMPFPRSGNLAWDYRLQDTWGYMVIFSVTFGPDGRAVSKISRRLNDGSSQSGK